MSQIISQAFPLVLYGAGRNAKRIYKMLVQKGEKPICFVDKDSEKWGEPAYNGSMLMVYSLDEIMQTYGNINVYVTIGGIQKYSVFAYLTEEKGMQVNRIINYEPYIKRTSCALLETTVAPLGERDVGLCRGGRFINVTKMPTVEWTDDAAETCDNFLTMRRRLIDEIAQTPENSPCNGCIVLREQVWPSEYRVTDYVLSTEPKSACQFKCIYCYAGHYGNNDFETNRSVNKNVDKRVNFLLELEKRNLANPSFTTISFSDGEICVDPKRDNLFGLTERYNSIIYTNAGVYSKRIASLLECEKTTIIVSVDAGTSETFKKIKGADVYDKVCENLRKYSNINNERVRLQYIYLPGKNDSDVDINGFVALCIELKTKIVSVLIDVLSDRTALPVESIAKLFILLDNLLRNNIDIYVGANVSLSEDERCKLWEIANNKNDGFTRDELYYKRLKLALTETVY